jgi:hypothetical protein
MQQSKKMQLQIHCSHFNSAIWWFEEDRNVFLIGPLLLFGQDASNRVRGSVYFGLAAFVYKDYG